MVRGRKSRPQPAERKLPAEKERGSDRQPERRSLPAPPRKNFPLLLASLLLFLCWFAYLLVVALRG